MGIFAFAEHIQPARSACVLMLACILCLGALPLAAASDARAYADEGPAAGSVDAAIEESAGGTGDEAAEQPNGARQGAESENTTDASNKTVEVALFEFSSFMSKNENRRYYGYNIDYLQEISKYAGWNLRYVDYGTWENAYSALLADEVDILPSVYYDQERSSEMIFSNSSVCEPYVALSIRVDDDRYTYEDFEHFEGMKVGVIADSEDEQAFAAYCTQNGFSVDTRYYTAVDTLLDDLHKGTLDAIAITYLGNSTDIRTVARFSPQPVYFAFANDRADVAQEFDSANSDLLLRNPELPAHLYNKYFSVNTNQNPLFTQEEYDYIEQAPVLTVVYDEERQPFSFTGDDGSVSGVVASFFGSISSETGLRFEFIACEDHAQCIDMVSQGNADIVYSIDNDFNSDSISATGIYLDNAIAQVSISSGPIETIALPRGFYYSAKVIQAFPDKQAFFYTNQKECCDAVLSGAVDAAYLDVLSAAYLVSLGPYNAMNVNTVTTVTSDMSLGVAKNQDPRLVSILDRCVEYTPSAEMAQWVSEGSVHAESENLVAIIYNNPLAALAVVGILALLVILIALYIIRTKTKNNRRLEKLVYTDPLTGGWNLLRFQKEVNRILAENKNHRYSIIYLDFCRFKSFNAAYGFAEGDRLLVTTNILLGDFIRTGECYAHINADEFVLLVQWEPWEEYETRFYDFDHRVNALSLLEKHNHRMVLAAGACLVEPYHIDGSTMSVSELIDCARYARESIGSDISRSTIMLYNSDMTERDLDERKLFNAAEKALAEGDFVAYYQPKVDIATNRIVGFEALARWNSRESGLISPASFIPLFERNGLIVELDLVLFRLTCQRLRNQLDQGEEIVPISCNFSRRHLDRNDFPEQLKAIADEYQISPEYLELELTENIVMEDIERAETICKRLKDFGFPISIDDFGSGYSSLGTLQHLPIDVLKMDRSFLLSSQEGGRNKIILKGIIDLATDLGVIIVVEGVETSEQAGMLHGFKQEGLIAQGFLYSRPVALEDSECQFERRYIHPQD